MNKILCATDGSPASTEAVELAVELAKDNDAHLFVIYVVPAFDVIPMSGLGLGGAVPREPTGSDYEVLEDARDIAERDGLFGVTTELLRGRAADEIVAYADNIRADVIVIGSRGHGTFASALLGSVSREVISQSRRPVTLVRARAQTTAGLVAA